MEGPILDLDDLIQEDVEFVLHGTERRLKAFDVATFLKTVASTQKLLDKSKDPDVEFKELVHAYYELFASCVDPITMEDVNNMKPAQCASLLSLIMRRQYGEDIAKTYDQKKRPKVSASYQSSKQPSFWQRLRFSLGGRQKLA